MLLMGCSKWLDKYKRTWNNAWYAESTIAVAAVWFTDDVCVITITFNTSSYLLWLDILDIDDILKARVQLPPVRLILCWEGRSPEC